MHRTGCYPQVVTAVLIVAVVGTLTIDGGWPLLGLALAAVAVVCHLQQKLRL